MPIFKSQEELDEFYKEDAAKCQQILEVNSKPYDQSIKVNDFIGFDSLKDYYDLKIYEKRQILQFEFKSILLKVNYSTREIYSGDNPSEKYEYFSADYFWIVQYRDEDHGKILARPETAIDKVNELFKPEELDFKYDITFSWKYYVLTDNKVQAAKVLDENLRKLILDYKGIVVEFSGKKRLFRFMTSTNSELLEQLIEFSILMP